MAEATVLEKDNGNDQIENMFDMMIVVWRKRLLILMIVSVTVASASIVNFFFIPPIYKNHFIISLPSFNNVSNDGSINPENIISNNDSVALLRVMDSKYYGVDKSYVKSIKSVPEGAHYLKVTILYKHLDIIKINDIAKAILKYLNQNDFFKKKTEIIIQNHKVKIKKQEEEVAGRESQLKRYKKEYEYLSNNLQKKEEIKKELTSTIESNDSFSYQINPFTILDSVVSDRMKLLSLSDDIKKMERDVSENRKLLMKNNSESISIKEFELVKSPDDSVKPYKPFKLKNITLSGLVALAFGIFLSIFLNYIERANQKFSRGSARLRPDH